MCRARSRNGRVDQQLAQPGGETHVTQFKLVLDCALQDLHEAPLEQRAVFLAEFSDRFRRRPRPFPKISHPVLTVKGANDLL